MKSKIASIIIIMATFTVTLVKMAGDSEQIILHWDFYGHATAYGEKYYLIVLPVISVLLYLVLLNASKSARVAIPLVLLILLYVTLCSAQVITLHPVVILAILMGIVIVQIREQILRRHK